MDRLDNYIELLSGKTEINECAYDFHYGYYTYNKLCNLGKFLLNEQPVFIFYFRIRYMTRRDLEKILKTHGLISIYSIRGSDYYQIKTLSHWYLKRILFLFKDNKEFQKLTNLNKLIFNITYAYELLQNLKGD